MSMGRFLGGAEAFGSDGNVGDLDLARFSAVISAAPIPIGVGIGALNADARINMERIESFISDDLVGNQWHLGFLGDLASIWQDYTGKGISYGIFDSGVDTRLSAFAGAYDASKEVEIDGHVYHGNYRPLAGPHGTAVAGLIGARADGDDTVGIAFDSKLTSVNIFDPLSGGGQDPGIYVNGTDPDKFYEAIANGNQFDVTNHSWGNQAFSHDLLFNRLYEGGFSNNLIKAVTFATDTGRDGLGTVMVKAAGNSGVNGGDPAFIRGVDVAADTEGNDRHWVSVGAFREIDGNASSYSNRGPSLLISAPSNDYDVVGGTGIWTTDVRGRDGYNLSDDAGGRLDYTDSFGGTSAATPITAGAIGLMLEANPELGWRDVKNILAASALLPVAPDAKPTTLVYAPGREVNLNEDVFHLNDRSGGSASGVNNGGYHYSTDYGYGALNAFGAVRMAEVWNLFGDAQTSANEQHITASRAFDRLILDPTFDQNFNPVLSTQTFTIDVKSRLDIEHLDLVYSYTSDNPLAATTNAFIINVTSPNGTTYRMSTYAFDTGVFGEGGMVGSEVVGLAGFRGEVTKGTWTISFSDLETVDQSIMKNISLEFYGTKTTTDQVYHYTDDFMAMRDADTDGDRSVLRDVNGGTDWADFSSVTDSVRLSLDRGGVAYIGGEEAFRIGRTTEIENIVGGSAGDDITGNALANHMLGMRGSDFLIGAGGDDFIVGAEGFDYLTGGDGQDVFYYDLGETVDQDVITDFGQDDLLAFADNLGDILQIAQAPFDAGGLLYLDDEQFGERITFSGLTVDALYLIREVDGTFYYASDRTAQVTNAIALSGKPVDATPTYAVNTHVTPTTDASTFVPNDYPDNFPRTTPAMVTGAAFSDAEDVVPTFHGGSGSMNELHAHTNLV